MSEKPTYAELEQQVRDLERDAVLDELDLLETLPIGISITTPQGHVMDINSAGLRMFGYTSKEDFFKVPAANHYYDPEDRERFKALHEKGMARNFEARFVRKDGTVFWGTLTSVSRPAKNESIYYINVFEDISVRKTATERSEHLERVLRAIRNVNQLITCETDRDRLLQGICKSLIQTRGYYNAWIAILNEQGDFQTSAEAGLGNDFIALVQQMRQGHLASCAREALSEPGIATTLNPRSDCPDCPLSASYGGRGAMTIRLENKGRIYGLLSASIPSYFIDDAEEQDFFKEVAGDIAFAMRAAEEREKRKATEEALKESKSILDATNRMAKVGGWEVDANTLEVTWTEETYRIHQVPLDYKPPLQETINFFHPEDRGQLEHAIQRALDHGEPYDMEIRFITAKGKHLWTRTICWPEIVDGKTVKLMGTFQDITDHKRLEKQLQYSRNMLQTVLDAMPSAVFWKDRNLNYLGGNRTWLKEAGLKSSEDVVGKSDYDLPWEKDHADSFREDDRRIMESGIPEYHIVEPYIRSDGARAWARTNKVPLRDERGNITGILGTYDDITELIHAEEESLASENKFRSIFENASDGILLADIDTKKFVIGNQRFCDMFGYDIEEIPHMGVENIHPREDLPYVINIFEKQARGEVNLAENMPCLKKDGTIFYSDINTAVTDIEGKKYNIGFFRDITDRKRAEEMLRESERKFRLVTETIKDVFWMSTPGISEILYVSPGYERIWRKSTQQLYKSPRSFLEVLHPEDLEKYLSIIEACHAKGKAYECEYRIIPEPGSMCWIQERGYPIFDDQGNIVLMTGLCSDITKRKKMEEEFLRIQKLESLGVFAGGIAHDFNNILTTILGNVSMVRMQVTPEGEIFEMLSEAEMASARAQTLTRQLLTFAKGGAPVKEIASIKDLLKESSSFVLRGSKSVCEFSIAKDLWPAEVDVGQISQVINNIVINANQAMPKGGTIQVAADNLIIEGGYDLLRVNPGRYIRISITDQGVGIAEDHLLNIFDPYFTTKQEGSGLGLATAYSIIKKHDGHISVESRPEVGTTFHIYLPASEKKVPEKEEVNHIKGQGRILVMDDEAPLRKMVGRLLKTLGYESEFAKDGAQAIEMYNAAKASQTPYDAVILDLTIPGGMGGKEAIDKLLKIDPEVKAVVSSGYSDDPVLANFQEYGFKGMMPKPFETRSLSKVLHEVLQGEMDV